MRRGNLRRGILILLILGLSLGALGYQRINIRFLGLNLQRGSEAVLGMRLGLDLQGGSHLVYQAKGTKEIKLSFLDPKPAAPDSATTRAKAVSDLLSRLGVSAPIVQVTSDRRLTISVASLKDAELDSTGKVVKPSEADSIRLLLEATFGATESFVVADGERGKLISVSFQNPMPLPTAETREAQVRAILKDFGKSGAQVNTSDDQNMTLLVDSLLAEQRDKDGVVIKVAEAEALKKALEERVGALSAFTLTDIPANPTADQMEGVLNTIERRVNPFGISEPVIQLMDKNRILVQLPGVHDVEEVKRLIGRTAQLEFKERHCIQKAPITISGATYYPCELPENHEDTEQGLTGEDLARAYPGTEPTLGRPIVNVQFTPRGTKIFADLTNKLYQTTVSNPANPDRFVIFLDEEELVAPIVKQPILSGAAFIEGGADFTPERVRTLSIQLESGRLPVPLELVQEQEVDATLGKDSLQKSLMAGGVGLGLTLLFMVLYYKASGLVAALALLIYTALVLAIFKVIPVTLTLAGIAGFILSIGMAVDANVLIFERMKEELRVGR
ncbi:MAG: protein translocase subunit SecD, partial [Chloroflexi bacterium]|nr:protein translocase subunit SecD [Chloroflexota bacterium]